VWQSGDAPGLISREVKALMSSNLPSENVTFKDRLKNNDLLKVVVVIILIALYMTNFSLAVKVTRAPGGEPSDAWMQALTWMRYNTPEPYDSDVYYKRFVGILK